MANLTATTPLALVQAVRSAVRAITPTMRPDLPWHLLDDEEHDSPVVVLSTADARKFAVWLDADTIQLHPQGQGIYGAAGFSTMVDVEIGVSYRSVRGQLAAMMIVADAVQLKRACNVIQDPGTPGILLIDNPGNPWRRASRDGEQVYGVYSFRAHVMFTGGV